jgi:hypothetical protein
MPEPIHRVKLLTVAARDHDPRRIGAHRMMGPPQGHEAQERIAESPWASSTRLKGTSQIPIAIA